MTTDELNTIVKAVMDELEKAGVDFDFKAETPQADDLVYVMRGTADRYQGITVKWQNLLDIIVKKATDAKDEAVSAKDIALQTLATIQGIESNVSLMKSSVEASEANVASMKASVETSEANVTQMKSDVSEMKTSVEGTKTAVENIKEETAGLLDTKVSYSDSLTYEQIMASTDLTNKVASADALKNSIKNKPLTSYIYENISEANRGDRYNAIVELRTLTRECFNRGSIVHILNNTGGYHTYIIGSTDPDFFIVLPLTFYSDTRLELYKYINGNWTRYYASMTQF